MTGDAAPRGASQQGHKPKPYQILLCAAVPPYLIAVWKQLSETAPASATSFQTIVRFAGQVQLEDWRPLIIESTPRLGELPISQLSAADGNILLRRRGREAEFPAHGEDAPPPVTSVEHVLSSDL